MHWLEMTRMANRKLNDRLQTASIDPSYKLGDEYWIEQGHD